MQVIKFSEHTSYRHGFHISSGSSNPHTSLDGPSGAHTDIFRENSYSRMQGHLSRGEIAADEIRWAREERTRAR